jgi:hypothetical protein
MESSEPTRQYTEAEIKASRAAPSRGASGMSGRPPRYALTRRKGRPANMLHLVKQCEAREA